MRYRITGTQPLQFEGKRVEPGDGEFEATLPEKQEAYLLASGAIVRVDSPEQVPTFIPAIDVDEDDGAPQRTKRRGGR